jgi:hypothetical protein
MITRPASNPPSNFNLLHKPYHPTSPTPHFPSPQLSRLSSLASQGVRDVSEAFGLIQMVMLRKRGGKGWREKVGERGGRGWLGDGLMNCLKGVCLACRLLAVLHTRFFMHGFSLLENEVIWGHIDILVVAVRRLSRRWKVKTLLAGSSPTSPMKRRLPTPLFPTFSPKISISLDFLIHYGAFRTGSLGKSVAKRISDGPK